MKKTLLITLLIIVFLTGCQDTSQQEDMQFIKYEKAYQKLKEQDQFVTISHFFDSEVVVNQVKDGYRLDLIIDNPKVAMYNIEIIYEINPEEGLQFEKMLPTIGLVDQDQYNMVPYQVNESAGFHKGIIVSGLSEQAEGKVIAMISWSDYAKTKEHVEFIEYYYGGDENE